MPLLIHTDPVPLRIDADGVLRVAGTRITLDTVVARYKEGDSAESIADAFPPLVSADVHAVLAYYLRHREEMDHYLEEGERRGAEALRNLGERYRPWAAVGAQLETRGGRPGDGTPTAGG